MLGLLLLAVLGLVCAAPTHDQQRQCLYEMYDALKGDSWWVKNNWPLSTQRTNTEDYCQFFGIGCDSSGNVNEINMPGNNLNGVLPTCIINFPLRVLSVPHNKLKQSIPYIKDGLEVLNLEQTEILVLATDLSAWKTIREMNLHKSHMDRNMIPSDFIFSANVENLDFSDAGIGFYAWGLDFTTISTPKLSLAGINMGDYIMSNVARGQMKILDVSGSWVKYHIKDFNDFLNCNNMVHIPYQYTYLSTIANFTTLPDISDSDTRAINVRQTNLTGIFNAEKWANFVINQTCDDFYMLDMSFNGLSGYAPTMGLYEKVSKLKPTARFLSLEHNSFFCNAKERTMFGCRYVYISDAYYDSQYQRLMLTVHYPNNAYAPLRELQHHMSVAFRNLTRYNSVKDPLRRIQNIETYNYIHARRTPDMNYFYVDVTIPYDEAVALGILSISRKDVGLLYDGRRISTRAINMIHEAGLDKDDARAQHPVTVDANGRRCTIPSGCRVDDEENEAKLPPLPSVSVSRRPATRMSYVHEEKQKREIAEKLIAGDKNKKMNLTWTYIGHKSDQKIAVDTYAMSRCGDFYERLQKVILPMFDQYPEITEIAQFKHFPLAEYNTRYPGGGISKHGYEEVKGDIQLLCAQEYLDTRTFYSLLKCLTTRGGKTALPKSYESCFKQVASSHGLLDKAIYCVNGEFGRALLEYTTRKVHSMCVANSPNIFIADKMACHGAMVYCATPDPESLAKQICQAFIQEHQYKPDICTNILG